MQRIQSQRTFNVLCVLFGGLMAALSVSAGYGLTLTPESPGFSQRVVAEADTEGSTVTLTVTVVVPSATRASVEFSSCAVGRGAYTTGYGSSTPEGGVIDTTSAFVCSVYARSGQRGRTGQYEVQFSGTVNYSYCVSFDAVGGGNAPALQTVEYGNALASVTPPVRMGMSSWDSSRSRMAAESNISMLPEGVLGNGPSGAAPHCTRHGGKGRI